MKKLILATAIVAASFGAAEAKCSKKSLNGNWMLHFAGQGIPVVIAGGTATVSTLTINFNLNDKCKGVGTIGDGMTTLPITIATERINPGSPLKPNLMEISYDAGGGSFAVLSFYRR